MLGAAGAFALLAGRYPPTMSTAAARGRIIQHAPLPSTIIACSGQLRARITPVDAIAVQRLGFQQMQHLFERFGRRQFDRLFRHGGGR